MARNIIADGRAGRRTAGPGAVAEVAVTGDQPQPGRWRSVLVGVVFGVDGAGLCLALATICFSGVLTAGLGLATALFLLGSAIGTMALYRYGGFRLSLAISQDTSIAILAPAVMAAAGSLAVASEARVATAFAVVGVSTLALAVVFWTIGRLGLGRLIRMFPCPVLAGFLASSGYILVYSAVLILTGQANLSGMAAAAMDPQVQIRLLPAVAMAAALLLAMRIWEGPTPVLVIIAMALASYYLVTAITGIDQSRALELGLLPDVGIGAGTGTGIDTTASLAMLQSIDWAAVAGTAPSIAAVVLLNLIGILLNTSGVELATGEDVDENRELRVTGAANMLVGAFGGLTSYIQSGATIISAKLQVQRGPMVFGHCAILLAGCLLAPPLVAVIPAFIPAGLLLFIGLTMIADWLLGTWRRLVPIDWLIVAIIVSLHAVAQARPHTDFQAARTAVLWLGRTDDLGVARADPARPRSQRSDPGFCRCPQL